jgi:hypothetical protein
MNKWVIKLNMFILVSFLAKQLIFEGQIYVVTYVFQNDISHKLQPG